MQWELETGDPMGRVGNWVFIAFFVLAKGGDVFQVQTDVSWEGEVSPWPLITFWDLLQSSLQFHSLELRRSKLG
jgi:hypothetical protein